MLMDVSRTIPSDAYLDAFNAALTAQVVGAVAATRTTTLRRVLHGGGGADRLREPGELADALESVKGWVNPGSRAPPKPARTPGRTRSRAASISRRTRSPLAAERVSRVGGRRAPIFAGVGVAVVVVLVLFFLVLPKMGQVNDANATLDRGAGATSDVGAQLAALQQAEAEAPINRRDDPEGPAGHPADRRPAGLHPAWYRTRRCSPRSTSSTITPSTPDLRSGHGPLDRDELDHCTGSYFAVTEFLFQIETLPRAAKIDVGSARAVADRAEREPADA